MEEMVKVLFMTNLVVMRRRLVYYSIAALCRVLCVRLPCCYDLPTDRRMINQIENARVCVFATRTTHDINV